MKLSGIAALYMTSPEWTALSQNSKRIYTQTLRHLDTIINKNADDITRPVIIDLRDRLFHKRGTCRNALSLLNNILSYGYDRGLCKYNHAQRVKGQPRPKSIARWSLEECQLFLKDAPDYVRLAFLLALYTGQRRGDLVRMEWSQYDGQTIKVLQEKTRRFLTIPVHPQLKAELDKAKLIKHTDPYILHNTQGDRMTAMYLTVLVRERAIRLGMENRSVHGLRKTAGAMLAELGCTPHQIMSILGHKTLKEVTHYTEEADQKRMGQEAMDKWETVSI